MRFGANRTCLALDGITCGNGRTISWSVCCYLPYKMAGTVQDQSKLIKIVTVHITAEDFIRQSCWQMKGSNTPSGWKKCFSCHGQMTWAVWKSAEKWPLSSAWEFCCRKRISYSAWMKTFCQFTVIAGWKSPSVPEGRSATNWITFTPARNQW